MKVQWKGVTARTRDTSPSGRRAGAWVPVNRQVGAEAASARFCLVPDMAGEHRSWERGAQPTAGAGGHIWQVADPSDTQW